MLYPVPPFKIGAPNPATYFRRFSTTSQLNGNFSGPYHCKTRYRESWNGVESYKWCRTAIRKIM